MALGRVMDSADKPEVMAILGTLHCGENALNESEQG